MWGEHYGAVPPVTASRCLSAGDKGRLPEGKRPLFGTTYRYFFKPIRRRQYGCQGARDLLQKGGVVVADIS